MGKTLLNLGTFLRVVVQEVRDLANIRRCVTFHHLVSYRHNSKSILLFALLMLCGGFTLVHELTKKE